MAFKIEICEAFFNPSAPIILMYIHEIGKILELPHGAAETAPIPFFGPDSLITSCVGKNSAKCLPQAMGPIPGPPPPCGIQKVLCKLI